MKFYLKPKDIERGVS